MLWMDEARTMFFWVPTHTDLPEGTDPLVTIKAAVYTDIGQLQEYAVERAQANVYAQQMLDEHFAAERKIASWVVEVLPEHPGEAGEEEDFFEMLQTTPEAFFGQEGMRSWWLAFKEQHGGSVDEAGKVLVEHFIQEAYQVRSACEEMLRK